MNPRIEQIKIRMAELDEQMKALECGDERYLPLKQEWRVLRDELNLLQ